MVLLLMVAGASQARAGTVSQVTLTTAPASGGSGTTTPATTPQTVAPTTLRTTATTRATATTRPAAGATAPATVAPVRVAPATVPVPVTRAAPTTVPAPTTTILGIRNQLPAGPATLPLRTTGSNGHVDPTFAWLSGIGFAIALAIVAARLFVTRPGGGDRAPLS